MPSLSCLVRRFLDERNLDKLDDLRAWGYDPTSKQRAFINNQTTRKNNPLSFREAFTNKFVADKRKIRGVGAGARRPALIPTPREPVISAN
jgi:hypothetical protein